MLALGMGITMLTGGINLSIIASANACSLVMAAVIVSHPDNPLFNQVLREHGSGKCFNKAAEGSS